MTHLNYLSNIYFGSTLVHKLQFEFMALVNLILNYIVRLFITFVSGLGLSFIAVFLLFYLNRLMLLSAGCRCQRISLSDLVCQFAVLMPRVTGFHTS